MSPSTCSFPGAALIPLLLALVLAESSPSACRSASAVSAPRGPEPANNASFDVKGLLRDLDGEFLKVAERDGR